MDHAAAAAAWIDTHPRAIAIFERMALARAQARQRFGMKALVEAVRWHYAIERTDQDLEWKLNNNHTAFIARWLCAKHPQIEECIELRRTRNEAA
jgi:hypothetical protein